MLVFIKMIRCFIIEYEMVLFGVCIGKILIYCFDKVKLVFLE